MFSFFKKKPAVSAPAPSTAPASPPTAASTPLAPVPSAPATAPFPSAPEPTAKPEAQQARQGWMQRLTQGLRKTGSSIASVFTGTKIDAALYEELEDALLMADTGVQATQHLLDELKRRVKDTKATDPAMVKTLLIDVLTDLLRPLEKPLAAI